MVVKNLEFFDKNGYNLNLNWNDERQIWEGNIFFPRVSVGLYENATIYIIENISCSSNGCSDSESDSDYTNDAYSYPTGEGNISFEWDIANTFVDEFFMFDFDEDYEIKDTSSLIHTPYDGPLCEMLIINRFDKYIAPLLDYSQTIEQDDLLEIHVAFMANEKSGESTYKRTLVLSYENGYIEYEIARITFFAETIEEDERLKIWNENLGYNLKSEDTIIFKHSDIHEYMPNFEILNEKRKELMLEGHNIYPYIGGYKSIINMIKFFGYDNLNIVEYWRNINEYDSEFGNIYRTYVYSLKNKKTLSTKRKPISLNTKNFKKLNNISLVYNINHPESVDGKKYDEYGLPNVIEDFDKRDDFILTIEEALVKLFLLKKKLNNEFMPGSTKITDIIGEANYFGINLIGNNPQISTVSYIESKGYIDFSVFPDKYCYITENEDFSRYIVDMISDTSIDKNIAILENVIIDELKEIYGEDSDKDITINDIDTRSLGQIISNLLNNNNNDIICEYYEKYYNELYNNIIEVEEEYKNINIPPEPKNIYKDVVSDIPNDPYGENEIVPDINICAKVVLKGSFSENIDNSSIVEWKITHIENGWSVIYTGDVEKYGNMFVQLPYLGNYDVEMTVWDTYNHCSKQYKKDAIIVKPYNIDIRGFYYDARPLPESLNYDLWIPHEYRDNDEEEKYYLWFIKKNGINEGIVTDKRNPLEMSLSNIVGKYNIDDIDTNGLEPEILNDEIRMISIVNTNDDENNILKISYVINIENITPSFGVISYKYVGEFGKDVYNNDSDGDLAENPFDDTLYGDNENLYNAIKKNVDKMYSWALQEHLGDIDENMTMRNYQEYQEGGKVSFKGPYYKFDVDNILYKIKKGYKEYDHLNEEIINLKPGKHYKYVRYINSVVDIKPLTWILLGFDNTKITGRIVNREYPKWTLTKIGNSLDNEPNFREDKVIAVHNGLYFTYLFEDEGVYKIKLEISDINDNKYEIEKPIVIVDKDANYEMYHTFKDEYDKYLEAKNE